MRKYLSTCLLITALAGGAANAQYSNAVVALSPVAYWPLNETVQPPAAFVATNSGVLGAKANGYYNNPYYPVGDGTYGQRNLFNGPQTGVTSDGDASAGFAGGVNANDNSGYLLIPQINGDLNVGNAFTAEIWVMPGGGDPNDTTGGSFSSSEWAGLIKIGGGGLFYTENGDASGNTYGFTLSMAGVNTLGFPVGWYGGVPYTGPIQLQTNATWVVDFFGGNNGNTPSLEFDVPFLEPTPTWFHLVVTYDGTNANFYTNGVLAATTVPGTPQSTNSVWAANQSPITSASGAYQFAAVNGKNFAPDTINPLCIGNINESFSIISQGFPAANAIGFNCQVFNGSVDEAAVYTNALSAAAIAKHYADATASNTNLYKADVLSSNPIVYLRFDEPAYTTPDSSTFPIAANYGSMGSAGQGLYQPGTIAATPGAPVAGFGAQSVAVEVNGLDAAVDVGQGTLSGSPLDPTGTTPFSVAAWFRSNPADCYGRFQTMIGRGDSGWRFSLDNSGHTRWNPGAGPELNSTVNYNDGAWHQIVGVSDGSTATMYVDGQVASTQGGVGNLGGTFQDLLIGGAPDYTTSDRNSSQQRYFPGQIAQVAFFPTALTSGQVQTLYNAADILPFITHEPVASITIGQGSSGSLSVTPGGTAPFGYQWFQGSTKLSEVPGNIVGSTNQTLVITNAILANAGNYSVVVSNAYGAVTSSITVVTISQLPTILSQPTPAFATNYVGNQITYSANVAGAATLKYQWYNGTNAISGATASNLVVTTVAGTSKYDLVITNSVGAVTSSVVTLVGQTFVPPPSGFVVNFAVPQNNVATNVYVGQGAYSDPGNNVWNPFPAASGTATAPALSSTSNQTLVTATLTYGFNNGATANTTQGTPSYLLAFEDAVNAGSPGIGTSLQPEGQIQFKGLPQGSYTIYLYAGNYDGNRGSIFSINPINGGVADGGTNDAENGSVIGGNAIANGTCTFAEGDNYVFFRGVTPDPTGLVTVTYISDTNAISGFSGEAPFDAAQVIGSTVTHPTLTVQPSGTNVVITWSPTSSILLSSTNATGPYAVVPGATSPYTTNTLSKQLYFRVHTP
ncbi:MAG TPA: LamG-like jellyroll fold domain-containing protein [Verrucomicrobiae bacterium]|jgi:hypothetical protein|nr:LamG-like jellyroll fold domain-containing protein [Verrucomicrobiae bacterium]